VLIYDVVQMIVFLLTECIMFDVNLTLASWCDRPVKSTRLSQQKRMEINTLVLKGKENVNDYVTVPSVVRSVDRYR
jgi:hypothetical protein